MPYDFALYLPDLRVFAGLGAALVVAVAFFGLGRLAGLREASGDILFISGWGCFVLAATLFGTATALPLIWILFPVLALGLILVSTSTRSAEAANGYRLLLLGGPLLFVMAPASASQWDEFAHWLVNQNYLIENGTFPRTGLPPSGTIFAGYPYALPLVGFVASRLAGHFVENAGALFNTLLVLVLARALAAAFNVGAGQSNPRVGWLASAVALMAATLLNPTFVPKLVFTTYADWSTAVVVGVSVLSAWRMVEAVANGQEEAGRSAGWHLGLALTVLVSLKQPNVILAVLLLSGLAVAGGTRAGVASGLVRLSPRVVLLPLVVYVAWRFHVVTHLPGREFSFMPLAEWLWSDLGAILGRMALIASKKGGYFGLMLVAVGMASHAIWQMLSRNTVSALGSLSILVAVPFLGYNAFLYLAYVGSFGAGEGQNAASYWRYNTQLGGAALIFAAAVAGSLHQHYATRWTVPRLVTPIVVILMLAAPLILAPKLRFDLNPVTRYVRAVGTDMADFVPAGGRVVVFDPGDNGKRALVLRYTLADRAEVRPFPGPSTQDPEVLRRVLESSEAVYLWVHVPTPEIVHALGVNLPALSSYLLARRPAGWQVLRSWAYPGYSDPAAKDD